MCHGGVKAGIVSNPMDQCGGKKVWFEPPQPQLAASPPPPPTQLQSTVVGLSSSDHNTTMRGENRAVADKWKKRNLSSNRGNSKRNPN